MERSEAARSCDSGMTMFFGIAYPVRVVRLSLFGVSFRSPGGLQVVGKSGKERKDCSMFGGCLLLRGRVLRSSGSFVQKETRECDGSRGLRERKKNDAVGT